MPVSMSQVELIISAFSTSKNKCLLNDFGKSECAKKENIQFWHIANFKILAKT